MAQMLAFNGNKLFYHTWAKDEEHYYEVDFILSRGNKICPIEVKSASYNRHKSLDIFCQKYSDRTLHKYLIYTKDLASDLDVSLIQQAPHFVNVRLAIISILYTTHRTSYTFTVRT